MWCWITAESVRNIILGGGLIGGAVFATWRCRTADRNLRREKCHMGIEGLKIDSTNSYAYRVAMAALLSDMLNQLSTEYDCSILRAFEAFLTYPPRFSGNVGEYRLGEVDYESRDTIIMVNALRCYTTKKWWKRWKWRPEPLRELPKGSPFTITPRTCDPNTCCEDYQKWLKATGNTPPKYS